VDFGSYNPVCVHLCPCAFFQHLEKVNDITSSSSASSDAEELEEIVQGEEDRQGPSDSLAEPEFSGLWDQDYKVHQNNFQP